jgi:DNA polymerase-3 subunit delta'
MSFTHLVGNEQIKQQLTRMVERNRVGQAFLFGGMAGVGKCAFAYAFARLLLNASEEDNIELHPDLFLFRGEGRMGLHSMENLRTLCSACRDNPYQAKRRVFIIDQADRMLPTSANALLKSFEEPASTSVIILVSDHPEALLDTILSRCQRLFFQAVAPDLLTTHLQSRCACDAETAARIAAQAQGSVARALDLLQGEGQQQRQLVIATLWAAQNGQIERVRNGAAQLVELLEKQREQEEAALREQWLPEESREWGAVQRGAIEQRIVGGGTLCYQHGLEAILETILSWCRDLHALSCGGSLINVDYKPSLQKSLQCMPPPTLEKALKATERARLGMQRSMPLTSLLEALFLSV